MNSKTSSFKAKVEYNPLSNVRTPLSAEFDKALSGNLVLATIEAVTSSSRRIFVIHYEVKSKLGRPYPGDDIMISEKNVFENLKNEAKKIKPANSMPTENIRFGYNLVSLYLANALLMGKDLSPQPALNSSSSSSKGRGPQGVWSKSGPGINPGSNQCSPEFKLVGPYKAASDFAQAVLSDAATVDMFQAHATKWKQALQGRPEELEKGVNCPASDLIRQYRQIKKGDIEKYDKAVERYEASKAFVAKLRGNHELLNDWNTKNPGKTLRELPEPKNIFVNIPRFKWIAIDSSLSNANTLVKGFMGEYKRDESISSITEIKQKKFPFAEEFNVRGISLIKDILTVKKEGQNEAVE